MGRKRIDPIDRAEAEARGRTSLARSIRGLADELGRIALDLRNPIRVTGDDRIRQASTTAQLLAVLLADVAFEVVAGKLTADVPEEPEAPEELPLMKAIEARQTKPVVAPDPAGTRARRRSAVGPKEEAPDFDEQIARAVKDVEEKKARTNEQKEWRDVPVTELVDLDMTQHEVLNSMEITTLGELAAYFEEDGFRALDIKFREAHKILAALELWWHEYEDGPLPFVDEGDCRGDREVTALLVDWLKRKRAGETAPRWGLWSDFEVTLEDGSPVRVVYNPKRLGRPDQIDGHFEFWGPLTSTGYRTHFADLVSKADDVPIETYAEMVAREVAAESAKKQAKEERREKRERKKQEKARPEPETIIPDLEAVLEAESDADAEEQGTEDQDLEDGPSVFALDTRPETTQRLVRRGITSIRQLAAAMKTERMADLCGVDAAEADRVTEQVMDIMATGQVTADPAENSLDIGRGHAGVVDIHAPGPKGETRPKRQSRKKPAQVDPPEDRPAEPDPAPELASTPAEEQTEETTPDGRGVPPHGEALYVVCGKGNTGLENPLYAVRSTSIAAVETYVASQHPKDHKLRIRADRGDQARLDLPIRDLVNRPMQVPDPVAKKPGSWLYIIHSRIGPKAPFQVPEFAVEATDREEGWRIVLAHAGADRARDLMMTADQEGIARQSKLPILTSAMYPHSQEAKQA